VLVRGQNGSPLGPEGLHSGFEFQKQPLHFQQSLTAGGVTVEDLSSEPVDLTEDGGDILLNPGIQIPKGLNLVPGEPELLLQLQGQGDVLSQSGAESVTMLRGVEAQGKGGDPPFCR